MAGGSLGDHCASFGQGVIGHMVSVKGSAATVGLTVAPDDGESRATVGGFVAILGATGAVIGMISEVVLTPRRDADATEPLALAAVDLIGEIAQGEAGPAFRRGVCQYPAIGDRVCLIGQRELEIMYRRSNVRTLDVGHLSQAPTIPACLDADQLLAKHFAVVGSTGVGKSSGIVAIVSELLVARPDVRILMLDVHNEYESVFGARAKSIDSDNLRLPFWLLNFEEMTDVIYGGKAAVPDEVEILAELIPVAKATYLGYADGGDRGLLQKKKPGHAGFTVDTPTPYQLQDLQTLINERMGRLENRASRMAHHRLMMRIDGIRNDPRYAFMFRDALAGGDSMVAVLDQLFSVESPDQPLTVLKLASLPDEVVDAMVCVISRLAFDFALWSDGALPLLLVCEEAHRYASADQVQGFAPARRALKRIAREGRKYGVHLGLVTQRPIELDPTILSQCSTLFAMRMTNDADQALMASAVSDAGANLLSFLPSLSAREAVGVGEGVPLPTRFLFRSMPHEMVPRSASGSRGEPDTAGGGDIVRRAVERWRGAMTSQGAKAEPAPAPLPAGVNQASQAAAGGAGGAVRPLHAADRAAVSNGLYTPLRR
jgi:uncharacterized protein